MKTQSLNNRIRISEKSRLIPAPDRYIYKYKRSEMLQKERNNMKKKVNLNSVAIVKQFVQASCNAPFEVEVTSDRYIVDGKSIMGVLSLNLSNPVTIGFESDDDVAVEAYLDSIKNYIVVE